MKCDECGEEFEGDVCTNCGLVINERPIVRGGINFPTRKSDITTLYSIDMRGMEHPLSPKIRKKGKDFRPEYQKDYDDYMYIKGYENISKICSQLNLPKIVKYEALNLLKGVADIDRKFFKINQLSPTYLACIKIACRLNDFPISNYDLSKVVDYKDGDIHYGYMEKKFNKAYKALINLYKLNITRPIHPKYIDYVCELLGLPYEFAVEIHKKYTGIRPYIQPHFKIEGYILALFYIFGREKYGILLDNLVDTFHVSQPTITSRRNEILNLFTVIVKFKDGREPKRIKGAAWLNFIGNLTVQGCMSNEKLEFDWENIEEVIVRCQ